MFKIKVLKLAEECDGTAVVLPKEKETMSDKKSSVGKPDRDRISLSQDYEVQDWSKKFNVTPEVLKKAVQQVGNNAKDVEKFLAQNK